MNVFQFRVFAGLSVWFQVLFVSLLTKTAAGIRLKAFGIGLLGICLATITGPAFALGSGGTVNTFAQQIIGTSSGTSPDCRIRAGFNVGGQQALDRKSVV